MTKEKKILSNKKSLSEEIPAEKELTEEELQSVAGGINNFGSNSIRPLDDTNKDSIEIKELII